MSSSSSLHSNIPREPPPSPAFSFYGFVGHFLISMGKRLICWRRSVFLLNLALLFTFSLLFLLFSYNKQFMRLPLHPRPISFNQRHFKYKMKDNQGREVFIVELLLPEGLASLQERVALEGVPKGQSLLLMWDLDFSEKNLRGCPEWNCLVTHNHSLLDQASAVFFASSNDQIRRRPGQYFVHYSQESPANMPFIASGHFFNMSFGFRMDGNAAASPYGFAARLAPDSRPERAQIEALLKGIMLGKSKPVAWFVSHCSTQSGREWIAKQMQEHIQVDIYGVCGPLKCAKGSKCKEMLDTDYFFYFAAENSICRDYLTEKIWDQGLDSLSVPIVLRRRLVEALLPPRSFIAVDDFPSIAQLAAHLRQLMANPREYLRYFEWRLEFVAVKLNGNTDSRAEKLFGMCQVCRLTQMEPRPRVELPGPMEEWWDGSCERRNKLVEQFKSPMA